MGARKEGEAKWVSNNEPPGSRSHKSKQQLDNQLTRKNRQSEQMLYALYTFCTCNIYVYIYSHMYMYTYTHRQTHTYRQTHTHIHKSLGNRCISKTEF